MAIADQVDDERDDAFSHVKEIELSRNDAILEADQVLAEIVRANRRPTAGELTYFQSELRWDERQVKAELRRMSNVLRLRGIAGSPADREAASAEADTAAAVLAKEQPKLQAKIDELQAKLRSLDADARLSAKRQADQAEAVEQLRTLCPAHIRESVRQAISEINATIGRAILDGEIRHTELSCCLDPSRYRGLNGPQDYLESLGRSFPAAVTVGLAGRYLRRSLSPEWPAIREAAEAELAELTTKLVELRSQHAEAIAAAELPLSFYC
jgi:cold shock CspA family protein